MAIGMARENDLLLGFVEFFRRQSRPHRSSRFLLPG
jgi:hypothetical protein